MTLGPGKYDHFASDIQKRTGATSVMIAIQDGNRGSGYAQAVAVKNPLQLPSALLIMAGGMRDVANKLEADAAALKAAITEIAATSKTADEAVRRINELMVSMGARDGTR